MTLTPQKSLQEVYDTLLAQSPLLLPGMEFIAPGGADTVYNAICASSPLVYRDDTSLYYWHCKLVPPVPPPMPQLLVPMTATSTATAIDLRQSQYVAMYADNGVDRNAAANIVHFDSSPVALRRHGGKRHSGRPASRRERRRQSFFIRKLAGGITSNVDKTQS
jgi:hypothetical protein